MNAPHIPDNPLTDLPGQIRAHWAKYRPNMTARYAAAGTLDERIANAARQTEEAVTGYVASATDMKPAEAFWVAWEMFRNDWAFLPAEVDEEAEAELDRELAARYAWLNQPDDDEEDEEDEEDLDEADNAWDDDDTWEDGATL